MSRSAQPRPRVLSAAGLAIRRAPNLAHDQLKKEQRRLRRLFVAREIGENTAFFFAAERRIGEDDIDAIFLADLGYLNCKRIVRTDLRRFQAVQRQIHLREQIRKRFRFATEDAALLK